MKAAALEGWVRECAELTQPERIHWCDGSEEENRALIQGMLRDGTLLELNQKKYPGCYLHRSDPSDVARTEHLTFVCTESREEAGPNNHWMPPDEAKRRVGALFARSMKGRTMYVVPYLMGPPGSPYSRAGVQITDSPYVAASLRILTRIGAIALEKLSRRDGLFVRGLHSLGDLSPDRRFILHFPEERLMWSVGSGYGGNALLSKKCHALRIASWEARQEGWLAEHMMIIGLQEPSGRTTYIAAAFPSQCGKTNLAMLSPPDPMKAAGWKVCTVGDDIAWMFVARDGTLRAINPEAGFFGVVPGTNRRTNPAAMEMISRRTIFTNVALTPEGTPWWEGLEEEPPPGVLDWRGNPWAPDDGRPAAHPNARFAAPIRNCPTVSAEWENPEGVPVSAILFGGRRPVVVPLVLEAEDWTHGVFLGASAASETTAAATGQVGVLRHDPMAMRPFCGYHMGDYFRHWLEVGRRLRRPPRIFHVNWFRKGPDGRYLWPGFGENLRVLRWIVSRVHGEAPAEKTPIGFLPRPRDLDLSGLSPAPDLAALLAVDREGWLAFLQEQKKFFEVFGDRMPSEIWEQLGALEKRLSEAGRAVSSPSFR